MVEAIVVNRKDLLKQLESVVAGLAVKETIDQSNCFVFKNGKVSTFNDEIFCSIDCSLKEIESSVMASQMLALLRKWTAESIKVKVVDGGLRFFQGRSRCEFKSNQVVDTARDVIESPSTWVDIPNGLVDNIQVASECVGKDRSKFALTCVHIHPDWIEATDDIQVIRCPMNTGVSEPLLIRASAIVQVLKSAVVQWSVTPNWIHFCTDDGLTLSCRKYLFKYPALGRFFECQGEKCELPDGIESIVSKCAIFSSEYDSTDYSSKGNVVSVSLVPGAIRLSGAGKFGRYEEEVKSNYSGKPIRFLLSPNLLVRIAKWKNCLVGTGKLKVQTDNWSYVTCIAKIGE